jgi:methanogenic corrinoid protein MtbC1
MEKNAHLIPKLRPYEDQLAAGNERMKQLFKSQDEELARAYETACVAVTDQESKEAWEHVEALQQQHSEKLDVIARWLEEGNEQILSVYFDSLKS